MSVPWYETHDNLVTTAHFMADRGDSAHAVARMIEKPWNHEEEYLRAWANYIVELDLDRSVPREKAAEQWKALQAVCPHPQTYQDDEDGLSCDICVRKLPVSA